LVVCRRPRPDLRLDDPLADERAAHLGRLEHIYVMVIEIVVIRGNDVDRERLKEGKRVLCSVLVNYKIQRHNIFQHVHDEK
jgi:hypothetical protein